MKTTIVILGMVMLPAIAWANGDHAGVHEMHSEQTMGQMQPGSHDMSHIGHDKHDEAAGRPGDPAKVSRTVNVTMNDNMRFTPDVFTFKAGQTVRFVVHDAGKIRHEMVIGSAEELKEHAEIMRANPMMHHTEPNMILLEPGQQGELIWQFVQPGVVEFVCLVPGHLEAGMTGAIMVE